MDIYEKNYKLLKNRNRDCWKIKRLFVNICGVVPYVLDCNIVVS